LQTAGARDVQTNAGWAQDAKATVDLLA